MFTTLRSELAKPQEQRGVEFAEYSGVMLCGRPEFTQRSVFTLQAGLVRPAVSLEEWISSDSGSGGSGGKMVTALLWPCFGCVTLVVCGVGLLW